MVKTITWKTKKKKEKGKEKSKDAQLTRTKEKKELVPLKIGSYLIHSPSCCLHANKEI
jgi:TFIIF-interacting CTD phosphatase-like protein